MMLIGRFFLILNLSFFSVICWGADKSLVWNYEAFPFLKSTSGDYLPLQLTLKNNKLNALLPRGAGTHRYLGVEQMYVGKQDQQRLFVKKKVRLSSTRPIGVWVPIAKGHVLHLQQHGSLTAYYAEGFNSSERTDLKKQFLKNHRSVSVLEILLPCASAEVKDPTSAVDEAPIPQNDADSGAVVGDAFLTCLAKKTGDSLWQSGVDAWETAKSTSQSVYEDPWGAAKTAGVLIYETGAFVATAQSRVIDAGVTYGIAAYKDPNQIYKNISTAADNMRKAGVEVYNRIAKAVDHWNSLSPAVKDLIICNAVADLAAQGLINALLSLTGAGTAVAAAKITATIYRYAKRIKMVERFLAWVEKAKSLPNEEFEQKVEDLLNGKMDEKELAALEQENATPDKPRITGTIRGNEAMAENLRKKQEAEAAKKPPTKRIKGTITGNEAMAKNLKEKNVTSDVKEIPKNSKIAAALVDHEFDEIVKEIPPEFLVDASKFKKIKEDVANQLYKDPHTNLSQLNKLDVVDKDFSAIRFNLLDQKKMFPIFKDEARKRFMDELSEKYGKAQAERIWDRVYSDKLLSKLIDDAVDESVDGSLRGGKVTKEGLLDQVSKSLIDKGWNSRWEREEQARIIRSQRRDDQEWNRLSPKEQQEIMDAEDRRFQDEYAMEQQEKADARLPGLIRRDMRSTQPLLPSKLNKNDPEYIAAVEKVSTAGRLETVTKSKQVKTNLESKCEACPEYLNFSAQDKHFDEHTAERMMGKEVVKTDDFYTALRGGKAKVATLAPRQLQALKAVAREKKSTTLWGVETRNNIIDNLKDIRLTAMEKRADDANTLALKGKHKDTEFLVIVCDKAPCKGDVNVGDVIAIYPTCGPDVLRLSALEDFDRCLSSTANAKCKPQKLVEFPKCKP